MKISHHEDWYKKRLQKILNIFGKDWFAGRQILELGACHGNIGIELAKLGAVVTFADVRNEHLESIDDKIKNYGIKYFLKNLNQEEKYNLEQTYDLTLHLGVLNHLINWRQDLECSLNSSKLMILETLVNPVMVPDMVKNINPLEFMKQYHGLQEKISYVCQESIETQIKKNNCSFIRFDNEELDSNISWDGTLMKHVFSWDYNNKVKSFMKNGEYVNVQHRRFWLICK